MYNSNCFSYRHRKFWVLAFVYAISVGVYFAWGSVVEVNLKPLNVSQVEYLLLHTLLQSQTQIPFMIVKSNFLSCFQSVSGWIGFYGSLASSATGMMVGL